jgi:hypothetical protein
MQQPGDGPAHVEPIADDVTRHVRIAHKHAIELDPHRSEHLVMPMQLIAPPPGMRTVNHTQTISNTRSTSTHCVGQTPARVIPDASTCHPLAIHFTLPPETLT